MSESTDTLLEAVRRLVGIDTPLEATTGPVLRIGGSLDHVPARSTASLASTTPKPYSWLNS